MIAPVAGVQHVVSLADGIVGTRPHLPPLVIAVASADDSTTARRFLNGYHKRLSNIQGDPPVPHALAAGAVLTAAAKDAELDVALLDELASQLSATVPSGAGRRWRPRLFQTCLDVIKANDIGAGPVLDRRRQLLDHLYTKWEKRTPWLAWVQRVSSAATMPSKVLGLLATAVFSGPSRWWFGRTLNGRRRRWFGDHIYNVDGLRGDFLTHALSLAPNGPLHDNVPLRRRILFDALLRDVDRFVKRRRFLPHRRRRRWTPVLTLDCTAELGPHCYDLVQLFVELTESMPTSPLLMIAAVEPNTLEQDAGVPDPVGTAVERLQSYVDGRPAALPHRPWLPVLLTSEPTDPTAAAWLASHHKVTPRVPGRVSALAPVVLTTVLALTAALVVTYKYFTSGCSDTWTNSLGERVGVIEQGCEFSPVTYAKGYPDLKALEKQVVDNNRAVDDMNDSAGAPRDYREVVFFAPLTRPIGVVERTEPANALWQLRGAVDTQKTLNESASRNNSQVPIKLVLANSGDLFHDGPDVASVIARQPQDGPGSLAAVIGISQSRQKSLDAINNLRGVAVIGSSIYGNHMTDGNNNFFMAAPPNDAFAEKMADWARNKKKYTSAVIVYDDIDTYYSKDLHDSLRDRLKGTFTLLDDVKLREQSSAGDNDVRAIAQKLCAGASKGILPVLTSRADQLRKLFTEGDQISECSDHKITMLAGPGAIVDVASGNVSEHPWLDFEYAALADSAVHSDESTGSDALLAASEAINGAAAANGNNPSASGVLYQLGQDGFSVYSRNGRFSFSPGERKDTSSKRVRILRAGS